MAATKTFKAGGDIRPSRFVKVDSTDNNVVLEADANDRILGISQAGGREAPQPSLSTVKAAEDGDQLAVRFPGEHTLLELGTGGTTAGNYLKSDADGKGVDIDETAGNKEEVGALAIESGSAGELVMVQVWRCTVTTET